MSNPNDYTVGWICAISTEYVAAQAFLDERHEGPDWVSPHDNNDYTLGKVGKHNVVIAVLPNGEYGIASATGVAKDMLHSFHNVRIGLMVGIGGGAPSPKHDIRLGDIVVSTPYNGMGGVFQYDFGLSIQGQTFQSIGFLNQPPSVLRAAVNGLMAQYESDGNEIERTIISILEKKPRLKKKYQRPKIDTDRLYQSRVIHAPNNDSSCTEICGDDTSKLISRLKRTEEEDNPTIHYGLIASANSLIMDALVRDKLAAEKDVLCFEMEAAGLMNNFPCLVIRGICDYSDSHTNKEWQGYAAMAAAGYAKDLLRRIPPNKVEAEKKIDDILSGVQEKVDRIHHVQHNQERDAILDWLTPINYGPQQSDFLNRRERGTGQWLLDSAKFQTWLENSKQTLFCPGIPGAGKTILSSIVINDLTSRFRNDTSIGIAYIYCNFRRKDEQKMESLLASLLKQLAECQPFLLDAVRNLYNEHKKNRTRPSLDEIASTLRSVVTTHSRVFFVIDALDECQVSDRCRTMFLSEIISLQAKCGANLFATSRFIPEIIENFQGTIQLEIRATKEDVKTYLDHRILPQRAFLKKNLELQEEIKTKIIEAVDGMFLLAQLHLDSLMGKKTESDVRRALESLPTGSEAYDKAYKDAMQRITKQDVDGAKLAKQALYWITCAERPLITVELQHAIAIKPGMSDFDDNGQPDMEDVVSVCSGLVTVDEESNIVRLVHFTTQEYFERMRGYWFPNAEIDITTACVTYLSFTVFESGHCQTMSEFEERLQSNKFYSYAAKNWGHHARRASTPSQAVFDFLESEMKIDASSQSLFAVNDYHSRNAIYSPKIPRSMTGLHMAAYFGINVSVKLILGTGKVDVNLKDFYHRTPLSWAAENGHEAVVKLLLNMGNIDVNLKDSYDQTPLLWAVIKGNEAIVKLLLNTGKVDVNLKDSYGRTPLLWAVKNGHDAIVKLLLNIGNIDVNLKDSYDWTPVSWAAENGHDTIIKLLLNTGKVDISLKS